MKINHAQVANYSPTIPRNCRCLWTYTDGRWTREHVDNCPYHNNSVTGVALSAQMWEAGKGRNRQWRKEMRISKRVAIAGIASAAFLTIGGGAAYAAGGSTPTPTPSPSVSQPVIPGIGQLPASPDVSPAPLPVFPRVNPLRGCRLTLTDEVTWVPQTRQFSVTADPSITCLDRAGNVQVYLLQR